MKRATLITSLWLVILLFPSLALGQSRPFVGDEGLEPGERRGEVSLGTQGMAALYRIGYKRSGLTFVYGIERSHVGGFTAAGAGVAYRLLEGYPLRVVGRLYGELGAARLGGLSLGAKAIPGVDVELGREGGACFTLGSRGALGLFVKPEAGLTLDFMLDGTLSIPLGDTWRGALGAQVQTGSLPLDSSRSGLTTLSTEFLFALARWF